MPREPLPSNIAEFLAAPRPSVMATTRGDGTPASTPCWYELLSDDHVLLSTYSSAMRLRNLRSNPAISLTVIDLDDWYTHVNLFGAVTEIREDPELADADRLSMRYTGKPFEERVSCTSVQFKVARWHSYGALRV